MMFEVQDFQVRRFAQHFEQAAVVEFAAQFAERLRLIVAAGNRREGRQLRAHPRLAHPRAHRPAGHGHAFHAAPPGPRALQAKADRLARNPGGRAPAHQLAFLHGGENAVVGKQRGGGIVSEAGKAQDVHRNPRLTALIALARKRRASEEATAFSLQTQLLWPRVFRPGLFLPR